MDSRSAFESVHSCPSSRDSQVCDIPAQGIYCDIEMCAARRYCCLCRAMFFRTVLGGTLSYALGTNLGKIREQDCRFFSGTLFSITHEAFDGLAGFNVCTFEISIML